MGSDQTLNTHRVMLIGASSQIGVFAIPQLANAGFQVVAVSRQAKPDGWPDYPRVSWVRPAEMLNAAVDCSCLVSAGPIDLAVDILDKNPQIQKAVIFSSSSIHSKTHSANEEEREQIESMLKAHQSLRRLDQQRSLKLVVFKPTMIYGCGLDTNISRLAAWVKRFGFLPVNGRARGLRQPVHAQDLATAALSALQTDAELPIEMFLGGGETLSYREMAARIATAMGRPNRLLGLPQWLFVLLVKIVSFFSSSRGLNTEMVRRQTVDLVFDDNDARHLLAYAPRSFNPESSDFELPW